MMNKINENSEFNHFKELANQWWLQNGKFKILHEITPLRIEYIKKSIKTKKNRNILNNLEILDLGCGGGLICEPLARLGAKVTGIDFIKQNIDIAKKHATKSNLKIVYFKQDLTSLKLDQKYDLILLFEVIEHIEHWKKIIKKCKKYLKSDGKIIFSTINRTLLSKIFAIYFSENILKWVPKKTHIYNKLIKPEELIDFLKEINMNTVDVTGLVYNPIIREWKLKKNLTKINYFCTAENI